MRVLITGKGKSGSWKIRGEQIGAAIGATVKPMATVDDMRAHDVTVLVKRPTAQLLQNLRDSGKPYAWDVVDAYPQPEGNSWDAKRALTWLHTMIGDVRPNLLICATRAMLVDAEFDRACVIYHHGRGARIKLARTPHRQIAYCGGPHYLGRYEQAIANECRRTGWLFDKTYIEGSDAVVCLRDCKGYAPRHWKSNVKLANAQALGIPALCSPEAGYKETSTGGVLWIDSPADLPAAFDALADPARYAELCAGVDAPPTLAEVAALYADELAKLC